MFKKIVISILIFLSFTQSAYAVEDPRLFSNNKFGINLISPEAELDNASALVNTNGDWGWVVITLTKNERDLGRMQNLLNTLNEKHLIPIIRLATNFDTKSGSWEKPGENDANEWADFLSQLHYPTKNIYIEVYNEVNRAAEWGDDVSPSSYALELSKTIDALKLKNPDFFILNAPLDLALPTSRNSLEAASFFAQMESAVPGIFDRLDGWASHSYPNPNFSASPAFSGRIGINGYLWELSEISKYSKKDLPVFITETGWKRDDSGRDGVAEKKISDYYQMAFSSVWNDPKVVTVAPFVLSYPQEPFTQFSFFKNLSDNAAYSYFETIKNFLKVKGAPARTNSISLISFSGESLLQRIGGYNELKIKNTGNYILNPSKDFSVKVIGEGLVLNKVTWDKEVLFPGAEASAIVSIKNIASKDIPSQIEIWAGSQRLAGKEIIIYNPDLVSLISAQTKTLSASFRNGESEIKAL